MNGERLKMTTYNFKSHEEAKEYEKEINAEVDKWSKIVNSFEKYPNGMIPDHVRELSEWKEADKNFKIAFKELRKFNGWYVKEFMKKKRKQKKVTKSKINGIITTEELKMKKYIFNGVQLTDETIQKTRKICHDDALASIVEAESGKTYVNDFEYFSKWKKIDAKKYMAGEYDNVVAFLQRAYYIQTGESVPLLNF